MQAESFPIGAAPAICCDEPSRHVYLFVPGQNGRKEEAADFAAVAALQGWQVLGIDLPGYGSRTSEIVDFVPWKIVPELHHREERNCSPALPH